MPWEILRWLQVKEASASISERYLVWGKAQCSRCVSLVPCFCHREPEVPHPLGLSFLHKRETVRESVCILAFERHTFMNLTETTECSRKCFHEMGTCTQAFMHSSDRPNNPWHCRSHKTPTSASKCWTKVPFNYQAKVHETSLLWFTIWSLEWFSMEKRHAISSPGEVTH